MTSTSPCMVHHSTVLARRGRGQASRSLMWSGRGIKLLVVEHFPGAGFAGATARGHAGAGLQLLERARAFEDRLLQTTLGDPVAQTDVHMRCYLAPGMIGEGGLECKSFAFKCEPDLGGQSLSDTKCTAPGSCIAVRHA